MKQNPRLFKQQTQNRKKKEAVRAYCHARREEKQARRAYRKHRREAWEDKREALHQSNRHLAYLEKIKRVGAVSSSVKQEESRQNQARYADSTSIPGWTWTLRQLFSSSSSIVWDEVIHPD